MTVYYKIELSIKTKTCLDARDPADMRPILLNAYQTLKTVVHVIIKVKEFCYQKILVHKRGLNEGKCVSEC